MKITSFNVCGLRKRLKKGFDIAKLPTDVLCLQEVKAEKHQIGSDFQKGDRQWLGRYGYEQPGIIRGGVNFYHLEPSTVKKGKYGVLTAVTQDALIEYSPDLSLETQYDTSNYVIHHESKIFAGQTGRAIFSKFPAFNLVNVYVPNSGELKRIQERVEWMDELIQFVSGLKERTVICGDFNVIPEDRDTSRDFKNIKAGRDERERSCYEKLLGVGFTDAWRHMHPEEAAYTWFSNRFGYQGRKKCKGDRIDLFLVSNDSVEKIKSCEILRDLHYDSDHTPVQLDISWPHKVFNYENITKMENNRIQKIKRN